MVKITNGIDVFEVSKGAYNSIFSKQGYILMDNKSVKEENGKEPEKSEDDIFVEQLLETPLSQWDSKEVKKFASIKGIDVSSVQKLSEAKEIIKEYLHDNT